ncbi:hypothetical protein BFL35_13530 [Clavibacter michiganensis]|nr:hypothetical protein BFL35_13530 [Clavibacter michiganensis]
MSRIGMKLRMGPGVTPRASANRPSWKIATTVPNDTITLSRKPTAALTGTKIDRNTIISRMIDSPTTTIPNGTSAWSSRCEMSFCTAVVPVTDTRVS